jgi:hypothetical protein
MSRHNVTARIGHNATVCAGLKFYSIFFQWNTCLSRTGGSARQTRTFFSLHLSDSHSAFSEIFSAHLFLPILFSPIFFAQ